MFLWRNTVRYFLMGAEKGSSFSLRISTQSMENALQPDTARPTAEAMNPLRDARPRLGN